MPSVPVEIAVCVRPMDAVPAVSLVKVCVEQVQLCNDCDTLVTVYSV